jgi:hypothetical protein
MKSNSNVSCFKIAGLFLILLLSASSCVKEPHEQTAIADNPFKTGTKLSYTVNETSFSKGMSKGDFKSVGGMDINTEKREVNMYFDKSTNMYFIKTIRLDGVKSKSKDFVEPEWKEIVETNSSTIMYNERGKMISTQTKTDKLNQNLAFLVTPYTERASQMKEMLKDFSVKSKSLLVEVQSDTNVVKITRIFEQGNEIDENIVGCTAISYLNVMYGVPVVSEFYDKSGKLTSKVTMLYAMINSIPIVAYEEAISYSVDYTGETIENKVITHYENINVTNF